MYVENYKIILKKAITDVARVQITKLKEILMHLVSVLLFLVHIM